MATYTIRDALEAATGTFVATLIFFALRAGDTFSFNATAGFVLSIFWVGILYTEARNNKFFINLGVVSALSFFLARTFGLINGAFDFQTMFGSPVTIAIWIALPLALLFEKKNVISIMRTRYIR